MQLEIKQIKKGDVFTEVAYGRKNRNFTARTNAYRKNGGWQVFGVDGDGRAFSFFCHNKYRQYGPRLESVVQTPKNRKIKANDYVSFDYPKHGVGELVKREGLVTQIFDKSFYLQSGESTKRFSFNKVKNLEFYENIKIDFNDFDKKTLVYFIQESIYQNISVNQVIVNILEEMLDEVEKQS
jgi:hypothetical protein